MMLSGLLTFGFYSLKAYIYNTPPLTTAQAFTSLALIGLVTQPATQLLHKIASIGASLGCLDRIQTFLCAQHVDERQFFRHSHNGLLNSGGVNNEVDVRNQIILRTSDLVLDIPNTFLEGLKAINMAVPKDSFTVLFGPVGCGKSTLIKTLLGETKAKAGIVSLRSGFIGFCAQDPWIQNCTIRQNIVGPNAFDMEWYHEVVRVASLQKDFQQMPLNDSTKVGSKGITLSGGQKHRIVSF
jgi:ATP-binding cassette subfamily C (CFTR/MRP) protein 1